MITAPQTITREIPTNHEINAEGNHMSSCFQIREKLAALLDGDSRLEETHVAIKRVLFTHLETCDACSRSFDVRARFRSSRGRGIL